MAIIDVATLKTFLGITTTKEDALLGYVVDAVNVSINSYLGRQLESTEYESELYDGSGTDALCLKNYPIVEVTTIKVFEVEVLERTDTQDSWGWYIRDPESGIVFYDPCWPRVRGCITVSYEAGYEDIPADILLGTLEMAAYYRNTISKRAGVTSQNLGSFSQTFAGIGQVADRLTVPSVAFRMLLDNYRLQYYPDLSF
jgi:hypothetical protein